MLRVVLTSAALALAAPAAAQDLAPALDPTATGQGIVASNIARQARGGRAATATRSANARATCARRAEYRVRYGAEDARVQKLERLCQQAGY